MKTFLKNVLPYYRPYRTAVWVGLAMTVLGNVFAVAQPWLIRDAINGLQTQISGRQIWILAGLIVVAALGSGLFTWGKRRLIIGVSRSIEFDIRQQLMRHLIALEPAFYDRSRIGDLMTRSTSDIEQVRMVIGPALMYMTTTVTSFIFSIALMMRISMQLTVIVLILGPIISSLVFLIGKLMQRASTESQEAFSDLSAMVQENLSGMRVVQAFRQVESQKEHFADRSSNLKRANLRLVLLNGSFFPAIMLIFGIAVALILLYGGKAIIDGKMLVGDFVAFTSYLMMLTWPMISTGWVVSLVQRGRASMVRIRALLDREVGLADPESPRSEPVKSGEVVFDKVNFRYPEAEVDSLIDLSFTLAPGKTLGVVGRVGSGKSTIAHLMTRLYSPQQGRIEVEGVELGEWSAEALRNRITVVPQEALLFSTSIRDNITLGGEYSDEEVERAVTVSRLDQDVEDFPFGLNTEVGERGITLSGGQKQRVAIARAVIRQPQIVIFDDALSAVDAETEERILENFHAFLKGRTALIISHRVTSVATADEVLVLEEGRAVERGHHDQLLVKDGVYAQIFREQRLKSELEGVA